MRGVTAALDKAREQISDATWREGLALEKARPRSGLGFTNPLSKPPTQRCQLPQAAC